MVKEYEKYPYVLRIIFTILCYEVRDISVRKKVYMLPQK